MTASAAEPIAETPEMPDLPALADALYEIVSSGGGLGMPRQAVVQVERFLHEHARKPKSRAEFVAFFEAQTLPLPDGANGFAEPTLSELSFGRMPIPRAPEDPRPLSLDVMRELAEATNPRIELPEPQVSARPTVASLAPWVILAVVVGLCGAGAWWGYETLTGLRGELREAERRGDESQRVVRELQGRAQALEDRAEGIQSSIAASAELMQRMDQKSDLLLERLPEPKPRRWARPRVEPLPQSEPDAL